MNFKWSYISVSIGIVFPPPINFDVLRPWHHLFFTNIHTWDCTSAYFLICYGYRFPNVYNNVGTCDNQITIWSFSSTYMIHLWSSYNYANIWQIDAIDYKTFTFYDSGPSFLFWHFSFGTTTIRNFHWNGQLSPGKSDKILRQINAKLWKWQIQ